MTTVFQFLGRRGRATAILGQLGFAALVAVAGAAAQEPAAAAIGREVEPGVREALWIHPDASGALARPATKRLDLGDLPRVDPKSVPGEKVWSALLTDDFESDFPGTTWTVTYFNVEAWWGPWTCWDGSATHSVGCAAAGPSAIGCNEKYPNSMRTWMVAGPFDLTDAAILDAVLEVYLNLNCEPEVLETFMDSFFMGVSTDASDFYGYTYAGTNIRTYSLDLTNVYTLGDLRGESQVWVGFAFASDSSVNLANGAQIDDVLLAVDLDINQPPLVTLEHPVGGEILTIGYTETVQFSVTDPDAGPDDLSIALDYSTDGGATWTPIAAGLAYDGTYDWTVPNDPTTLGRLRVRAFDGEGEGSDSSAADFAIIDNEVPSVVLLQPNGGEMLAADAHTTISYTAGDTDDGPSALRLALEYSTDQGASWNPIADDLPNSGSYSWTTPDLTSTRALVRATAWDGSASASDVSDAVFAIAQTVSTLTLSDGSGASGTTVTLELALENEVPVGGLQADLVFDGSKTFLSGIAGVGRADGAVVEAEQTGENRARILIYFDDAGEVAAGTGAIAQIELTLQGPGGVTTPVDLQDVVLGDPDGGGLAVESSGGLLTIGTPEDAPVLQISALKNPARPRTLQILVQVDNGSGDAPTVTANGSNVSLIGLGQAIYLATWSGAESAASVTINATDSNIQGIGTAQITVEFP